MPESFVSVKKRILTEAADLDIKMTNNRAKALAGRYLETLDPELDDGTTDYADPTGNEAVRRWMQDLFNTLDLERKAL